METSSTVFYANNLTDILYQLKNVSRVELCAGCTTFQQLPPIALIIRNVEELKFIDKRERFVEFGASVPLSVILDLGQKRLPSFFYEAVKSIANPFIRNMATIGGNICRTDVRGTLYAPLLASDASLDFRTANEVITIPMTKFFGIPKGGFLTKIRLPLEEWDISVFRQLNPVLRLNENSASFVFLAKTEKGILLKIRIALCGLIRFRSGDLESRLLSSKLPLSKKTIEEILELAGNKFDKEANEFMLTTDTDYSQIFFILRVKFLNVLKYSMYLLT